MSLNRPKLKVSLKKRACNHFCKDIQGKIKVKKGSTVSDESFIIQKNGRRFNANNKKAKNYIDFYKGTTVSRGLPKISEISYRQSGVYQPLQKV